MRAISKYGMATSSFKDDILWSFLLRYLRHNGMLCQTRTGGVLGAVPSAAV